jgi:hypothetical protein
VLEVLRTEIEFEDHAQGAELVKTLFGVGPELLSRRRGLGHSDLPSAERSTSFRGD